MTRLLAMLCVSLLALGVMAAQPAVLSITETPETQANTYGNGTGATMFTLEYFLSPQRLLAGNYAVMQTGWLDAGKALADVERYQAVILWDAPTRIADERKSDPYYTDVDVISPANAERLVQFVRNGGTLIMAGGVTCFGNGHEHLGSADYRQGNKRKFIGYANSPLAAILPVEIPDKITLLPFFDAKKVRLTASIVKPDPMVDGLDFNNWPFVAYHKVTAKPDADVLVATTTGDPLVVRATVGKGRVICVTASPRGSILFSARSVIKPIPNPIWSDEAILWDRALRWGLGQPVANAARDRQMATRYEALTANPPRVPLAVKRQEYPYAAHVLDASMPLTVRDLGMKFYASLGFNHIVMQEMGGFSEDFLALYAQGLANNSLQAFLHPEPQGAIRKFTKEPLDYAVITRPSGNWVLHYGSPFPDPLNPKVQQAAADMIRERAEMAKKYPNIRGAFYDDEWAWGGFYRNPYEKDQGIGNYSPSANAYFKQITGMEVPPLPAYREPGYVIAENDPFLKWCQVIRQDAFKDYNQKIYDAVKGVHPDLMLSNYPGGFEGNLDIMIEEVYLDCWKESELRAAERLDMRANFRGDAKRDKYPTWALIGIFRMPEDKGIYAESLRLQTGVCLGSGYKGIILWNSVNFWAPYMNHPGREPMMNEVQRLGNYLQQYGPMFLHLKKAESPVWLHSGWFWINSYDAFYHLPMPDQSKDMERPWWKFQVDDIAIPAAMRAGLPLECVTEKQLMSEELFTKKAVIVPGMLYCREAVVKNLEAYIKQGGKVFVDQSTKVKINGATVLPVDFSKWHYDIAAGKRPVIQPTEPMYRKHKAISEAYVEEAIPIIEQYITRAVAPNVSIDNKDAAYRMMENGDTQYLFVYNSDTDKGNTFTVTCRNFPAVAYDVEDNRTVKLKKVDGGAQFTVTLPGGGWKVFAFSPTAISGVRINQATVQNDTLTLQVRALAGRNTFRAAVPVKITLQSPEGDTVLYRATDDGVLDLTVPIADSIKRPRSIVVEELFSGKTAKSRVK
jgi:uncharacterized membrane protein